MDTVAAIFERFGGPAKLAGVIGVTTEHAATMRRRGSIPVRYWPKLCDAPPSDSSDGITYADLVAAHAGQQVSPEPQSAA